MLTQGGKDTRLKGGQVPVGALEYLGIEAKLIPEVLKEQTNVVTRSLCDCVDACSIETVLGEDRFRSIQDRLTGKPGVSMGQGAFLLTNGGMGILEAFLATPFEGGRHEKRVQKIREAESERDEASTTKS